MYFGIPKHSQLFTLRQQNGFHSGAGHGLPVYVFVVAINCGNSFLVCKFVMFPATKEMNENNEIVDSSQIPSV